MRTYQLPKHLTEGLLPWILRKKAKSNLGVLKYNFATKPRVCSPVCVHVLELELFAFV